MMLVIYVSGLSTGFAQEFQAEKSGSRIRLEMYLEKGNSQTDIRQWKENAELGLAAAMQAWEMENAALKEKDIFRWTEARNDAQKSFEMEAGRAYALWICKDLWNDFEAESLSELKQRIQKAAENRVSESADLKTAAQEEENWQKTCTQIINSYLQEWEAEKGSRFLSRVAADTPYFIAMEELSSIAGEQKNQFVQAIETEGNAIALKEGRSLMMHLVYDQNSVKNEAAFRSAENTVQELASQVQAQTKEQMEKLFASLETESLGFSENSDESVIKSSWIEKFKAEFERGIALWENAEVELLEQRTVWENQARQSFAESEESWKKAYQELKDKRQEWEKTIGEKLLCAEKNLEQQRCVYLEEIKNNLAAYKKSLDETLEKNERVCQMQSEVYEKTRALTVTARQGIESWGGLWSSRYRGIYEFWNEKTPEELDSILAANKNTGLKSFDVKSLDESKIQKISVELAGFQNRLIQKAVKIYKQGVLNAKNAAEKQVNTINSFITSYIFESEYDFYGEETRVPSRYRISFETSEEDVRKIVEKIEDKIYRNCEYETSDGNYTFDYESYNSEVQELEDAVSNLLSNRQRYHYLEEFHNSAEILEKHLANGEYAEIETYLKDLSEKKVITTDACITVEDLNSCRELETWLSTCLKSKKLGEQAQESLYSLAETARIGRDDFYDELEIEIAKAECIVKARQEEKEIAEAVNEYAENSLWSRESAETTEAKLKETQEKYEKARQDYEAQTEKLTEYALKIKKSENEMNSSLENLKNAEQQVKEAKEKYDAALAVSAGLSQENTVLQLMALVKSYAEKLSEKEQAEKSIFQAQAKEIFETSRKNFAADRAEYINSLDSEIQLLEEIEKADVSSGKACEKFRENGCDAVLVELGEKQDALYASGGENSGEWQQNLECIGVYIKYLKSVAKIKKEITEKGKQEFYAEQLPVDFAEYKKQQQVSESDKICAGEGEIKGEEYACVGEAEKTEKTEFQEFYEELVGRFEREKADYEEEALAYNYEYITEKDLNLLAKIKNFTEANENALKSGKNLAELCSSTVEYALCIKKLSIKMSSSFMEMSDRYIESFFESSSLYSIFSSRSDKEKFMQDVNERYAESCMQYEKLCESMDSLNKDENSSGILKEKHEIPEADMVKMLRLSLELTLLSKIKSLSSYYGEQWYSQLIQSGFCRDENLGESDRDYMERTLSAMQDKIIKFADEKTRVQKELLFASFSREAEDCAMKESVESMEEQESCSSEDYKQLLNNIDELYSRLTSLSIQYIQFSNAGNLAYISKLQEELNLAHEKAAAFQGEYLKAAQKVQDECREYNARIEQTGRIYNALEEKRLARRKAQEIYDWASSVYLENLGKAGEYAYETPKERLTRASYAFDRASASLNALKKILAERQAALSDKVANSQSIEKKLQSYIDADTMYYKSQVLSFEATVTLNQLKEQVSQAESEAQSKRLAVVKGTFFEKENSLVFVEENQEKNFVIRLRKSSDVQDNSTLQKEYLTEKRVTVKNSVNMDEEYSCAEDELYRWYSSIVSNSSRFENIALAAMCVLAKNGMLKPNPLEESGEYLTGIGNPHGIKAEGRYRNYREEILEQNYNSAMAAGLESDIAKCILYAYASDSDFSEKIEKYQKTILKERALDKLEDKMDDIKDSNTFIRRSRFWRWTVRTSKGWAAASAEDKAYDLKIGQRTLKKQYYNSMSENLKRAKAAENSKKSMTEKLNLALFSSKTKPQTAVDAKILAGKIKEAVAFSDTGIQNYVAELTGRVSQNSFTDVVEMLKAVNQVCLSQKETAFYDACRTYTQAKEMQKKQGKAYQTSVSEMTEIDSENADRLKSLALKASDKKLSIEERRKASQMYDEIFLGLTDDRQIIEKQLYDEARKIWGAGSVNTELFYKELLSHYRDYADPENLQNHFVDANRQTEEYYSSAIQSYIQMINSAEQAKNAALAEVYENELNSSFSRLMAEKNRIVNLIKETAMTAETEWDKAEKRMRASWNTWKRSFFKEYNEVTEQWTENYESFLCSKQDWINESYMNVSSDAGIQSMSLAGMKGDESIEKARQKMQSLAQSELETVNVREILEKMLSSAEFTSMAGRISALEERSTEKSVPLYSYTLYSGDSSLIHAEAELTMLSIRQQQEESSARLALYQAHQVLEEAVKGYKERIELANEGMKEWEKELVLNAGYKWSQKGISRSVVKDASLFNVSTRTQRIRMYEDFRTTEPEIELNVSETSHLGATQIMQAVENAWNRILEWGERIFGKQDSQQTTEGTLENNKILRKIKEKTYSVFTDSERLVYNESIKSLGGRGSGELGEHIGEAADGTNGGKISRATVRTKYGSGQIGLILLDYNENQAEEAEGWAALALPAWDKKLWSGSGAPSMRSVAQIATDVACSVVSAAVPVVGSAAALLIEAQTELIFAGLDYAGGYKTAWEAGNALGKKMAVSTMETLVTAGMSKIKASGSLSSTIVSAGGTAVTTAGGKAIENYSSGSGFDTNAFLRSMGSASTWSGVAASAAGSALNFLSGSRLDAEARKFYGGAVNLGCSLGSKSAEFGMYALDSFANGGGFYHAYDKMGGLTFNVANLGAMVDLAGVLIARNNSTGQSSLGGLSQSLNGVGIFEVNIGTGGVSGKLGAGGIDIGGNVYSLAKRMTDRTALARYTEKYGKDKGDAVTMNYIYGDWTQENASARLGKGKDMLEFVSGEGSEKGFTAQTTSIGKGRLIEMKDTGNKYINAIQLGHESYRDGIVSGTYSQKLETQRAVIAHAGSAGRMLNDTKNKDITLSASATVEGLLFNEGRLDLLKEHADKNYVSDGDFWKFTKEGNIVWDGENNLYDESGKLLHIYSGDGGHTKALAEGLGISESEAENMLKAGDYRWKSYKKTFVDKDGNDVKNDNTKAVITSDSVKVRYDFQYNYADKVNDKYGGSMKNALQGYIVDCLTNYSFDTPASKELIAQTLMITSPYYDFAEAYDDAMEKYRNVGNISIDTNIFKEIAVDFDNGIFSDDNAFYKYLEDVLDPTVGDSHITTKYRYFFGPNEVDKFNLSGKLHTEKQDTLACDIGSYGKSLPVIATENETFITGNSLGFTTDGGYNVTTYTSLFKKAYKHLQFNSESLNSLQTLSNYANLSGIYRFEIPVNYQIGNIGVDGPIGLSTGPHLHLEYTRRR